MQLARSSLRLNAGFLAVAGMVDYGLQLILPVILVRYLEPESFAQYRMAWLLAGTAMAVAPLHMPQALFYFLPRASPGERRVYVGNALGYLIAAGIVTALVAVLSRNLLPASMELVREHTYLVAAFLALWVIGGIVDVLPTAEGRARWQAAMVVFLAVARIVVIGAAAILTRDIAFVLLALCLTALIKGLLIVVYERSIQHGVALDRAVLGRQLRYALPFAIGNSLFLLRVQTDQWVVAAKFPAEIFAIVSIAAVVVAVSNLVRLPVNNALLPRVGELIAKKDMPGVEVVLAKGYTGIAILLLPFLGVLIACAHELVEIIYTSKYLAAAPVMQVYLIGQAAGVFAAGHLMVVAQRGRQAMVVNGLALVASLVLSLIGVTLFGYVGAAIGSVSALFLCEYWSLRIVARAFETTPARLVALGPTLTILAAVVVAVMGGALVRYLLMDSFGVLQRLLLIACVYGVILWVVGQSLGLRKPFASVLRRSD